MPFHGFKNWADCISEIRATGKDQTSAEKICGAMQAKAEGKGKKGKHMMKKKEMMMGK